MLKEDRPTRRRHVSAHEGARISWPYPSRHVPRRSQSYPFIRGEFDSDFDQRKMAYRAAGYWRSMLSRAGASHGSFATATKPKMFAATAGATNSDHHHERSSLLRGEYAPVGMVFAMLLVAMTIGMHTMKQQLAHSPGVRVSKKKRETVPEVDDPDSVVRSADKFLNKSFLRKVAHIQENKRTLPDPVRANPYTKPREAETLKMAGVNPTRR